MSTAPRRDPDPLAKKLLDAVNGHGPSDSIKAQLASAFAADASREADQRKAAADQRSAARRRGRPGFTALNADTDTIAAAMGLTPTNGEQL
jgi:hypothetical protein